MGVDLSGKWNFKEDFSYGEDEGIALLYQNGNRLTGILEFTETIEREMPFSVKCHLQGNIDGNNIIFHIKDYKIINSSVPIEYYPESREGIINVNGQIVGSSHDEQDICGVFVFERY